MKVLYGMTPATEYETHDFFALARDYPNRQPAILDRSRGPLVLGRVRGPLVEAARRGATAWGVDVAEAMVARAGAEHPGVEFRQADAQALPFEKGAFDAVLCNFGLPHFGRPELAVAEGVELEDGVTSPAQLLNVPTGVVPAGSTEVLSRSDPRPGPVKANGVSAVIRRLYLRPPRLTNFSGASTVMRSAGLTLSLAFRASC